MPTYEYRCMDCGRQFEVFQRMTEAPLDECSACKGRLKRLIGAGAGIIFKGSGFYCTDYRSDSYASAAKREKSSSTTGSGGSGSKPTGEKASTNSNSKGKSE